MVPGLLLAATTPNRRSSIANWRVSTWLNLSIVPPSSAARASKPSRTALRPRTIVLEGRARCPNSAELPAPVLLECKPKTGVLCDDRTTRNSGAAHQFGKPGNSPVCTGSDAGSASPEWPAIGPPTDPPTSALHPQVIRSCALAYVSYITHTLNQKSRTKVEPVEKSKNAGSTGLSWDLRQKLDYSPQHWQASSSRLPSSRVMLPAYAGPCLGSRPVAWLDGMVEILVLVEFTTGKGRERVRV